MFIEDFIALKKNPPKIEGRVLDVEYTTMPLGDRFRVNQKRVGTVFVGSQSECADYIKQSRTKQAIRTSEKGLNPFFSRWGF